MRLDGESAPRGATASVGDNPTFAGVQGRRIEIHVHDFAGDLYGREVEVRVLRLLRPIARLSGPGELVRRSAEDVRRSRALLLRLTASGSVWEWPSHSHTGIG